MVRKKIEMILLLILVCVSGRIFGSAQQDFTVLTIKKHENLRILNKYQDELTKDERMALPEPFSVIVEDSNFILSDQITCTVKARFGKTTIFIYKEGDRGLNKLFTEGLLSYGHASLLQGEPNTNLQNKSLVPVSNEKISRDFYTIRKSVSSRVEEVNLIYKHWFDHYNYKSGGSKPVPFWSVETKHEFVLSLKLAMPDYYDKQLKRSTQKLVADIESMLIGFEKFSVNQRYGEIVIEKEP